MLACQCVRENFSFAPLGLHCFPLAPTARESVEKVFARGQRRPPGLKPLMIQSNLRGPEGPLFHGCAKLHEFFRTLLRRGLHSCAASRLTNSYFDPRSRGRLSSRAHTSALPSAGVLTRACLRSQEYPPFVCTPIAPIRSAGSRPDRVVRHGWRESFRK
jgi:hypothetical protein